MSTELTSGQRIALYRKQKKLSQQKLADLIEVSRSYLGDIEAGRSEASGNVLTSIAKKTDVNPVWLLTGEGPMLRTPPAPQIPEPMPDAEPLTPKERAILAKYRKLDPKGQDEIQEAVEKIEWVKGLEQRVAELEKKAG